MCFNEFQPADIFIHLVNIGRHLHTSLEHINVERIVYDCCHVFSYSLKVHSGLLAFWCSSLLCQAPVKNKNIVKSATDIKQLCLLSNVALMSTGTVYLTVIDNCYRPCLSILINYQVEKSLAAAAASILELTNFIYTVYTFILIKKIGWGGINVLYIIFYNFIEKQKKMFRRGSVNAYQNQNNDTCRLK